MTEDELRKGLEGVMSKAGWAEDDIIDFVRDNLKSLVEIDKEGVIDAFIHSIPKKGLPNMRRVAKFIVKENPIKFKEK